MEQYVARGTGRTSLLSNALRQSAIGAQPAVAPLAEPALAEAEAPRVGSEDHDYAPGREDIGRYETSSTYDLGASEDTGALPVDPMRWTMLQDVLAQMGGPMGEQEVSAAAQPMLDEAAAAGEPEREQIDYDDPPPDNFKRFDGSVLPPDPTRSGHAPPKQPPGPSMMAIVAVILSVMVGALGIWIVIDFLHAL